MRDVIHFIARFAYWYGLVMFLLGFLASAVMPGLRIPSLVALGLCCIGSIVCGYCRFADKWDEQQARINRARWNAPVITTYAKEIDKVTVGRYRRTEDEQ